jgi:crotonobetainyl-CoA:carnitine CoA-transferase CaiB-like acyl-CoA transferase
MNLPLKDIRVLDVTSVVMGPYATQILGDLGADVITVEGPKMNSNRRMGAGKHPELHGIALNLLRNKRSVVIDLKSDSGQKQFMALLATCDVMITNLLPFRLKELAISYDDVKESNETLVYCQAQGWPTGSPEENQPAYDDVVQAASGLVDAAIRATGAATYVPTVVADKVAALTIVYSVLAALHERDNTGLGQRVEVPMVDTLRSFVLVEHAAGRTVDSQATSGYARILSKGRRPLQTADGHVCIVPYKSQNYADLYAAIGRLDPPDDERITGARADLKASEDLYSELAEVVVQLSTGEWLELCRAKNVPACAIATLDEIVDGLPIAFHPSAGPYRLIPNPVRFSGVKDSTVRIHAPLKGEHTAELLSRLQQN